MVNWLTDIFAVGKFDYGVMVGYQNLTRKPELFRAPLGPGMMSPPEPPLSLALGTTVICKRNIIN